jgi:hypothetical protein
MPKVSDGRTVRWRLEWSKQIDCMPKVSDGRTVRWRLEWSI